MTLTKKKPIRNTATRRRRTGHHHEINHHYIKAYWPYLPVFGLLLIGVVLNSWIGNLHRDVLGYATGLTSQSLLASTNDERMKSQASALQTNRALNEAAQAKANDMARHDYWSHISPTNKQPADFVMRTNYKYETMGENLAYGFSTSQGVVRAWMKSPEHRANILNGEYQDVGFAMANVPNYQGHGPTTIVVAVYAKPIGSFDSDELAPARHIPLGTVQSVSRIEMVTSATWIQLALAALCGSAITVYMIRHAFAWRRVLVKSELFILRHPLLDIALMGVVVIAFVASHWAGTIL